LVSYLYYLVVSLTNSISNLPISKSMSRYYDEYFPSRSLYRWLSYCSTKSRSNNREFSFTLPNDIYVRYLSFGSHESFKARLIKECPAKVDIGAVYNINPEDRKSVASSLPFVPIERELVFDIDMSDYNDIRTCCQ
jgi:DNA primase small subunit